MRKLPHPFSGAIYEETGEGLVCVTDEKKGLSGLFRWDGVWLEGNLTHADAHMLIAVGGPNLPPEKDIFWTMLPPTDDMPMPTLIGNPGRSGGDKASARPPLIAKYVGDPGMETEEGMRSAAYVPLDYFLENDRRPELIPDVFRRSSPMEGGPVKIVTDRFYDKKFHDLEVEKLWKKVWQVVCREDDIPEVGDHFVYDIAHLNFLVVRTSDSEIKAYPNACLHRGRQLRAHCGKKATEFRCPYHGWSWKIDGTLKELPSEWDFPGVREDVCQLPEIKVATWAGFVFINPDPDAVSLEQFMGPEMIEHYTKAKLQNRYKQADVVKVVACNWKVMLEAFLEAYHLFSTHPQLLLAGGDLADNRSDVFGNWSRLGFCNISVSSPHRGIVAPREHVLAAYRQMADFTREYLRSLIGDEVEQYADVELNEQSFNFLFPNFSPWGGWGRIVYQFRPHGDNPDECLMRAMLLAPWPEGKPKPPPRPTRYLGIDEPWTNAQELGTLAKIFEQDSANAIRQQIGLKAKLPPTVWYSGYQESVIRNFHRIYEETLGLDDSQ